MGETFTVGQKVKVVNNHLMSYGRQGVLTTFDPEINHWWVDFGEREFHFAPDELISADEPQPVAEWQDISGNDHALSQADAEHQPVLVSTPPAQSDDERQFEALEVAYVEATAGILKDDMTLAEWERARSERQGAADALIIAMQKRLTALNARLDAVTAERDALQAILKPIAALYEQYLEADLDEMSSDVFVDWLDDGEVQGRFHKAMRAAFRTIGYQHAKESDDGNG